MKVLNNILRFKYFLILIICFLISLCTKVDNSIFSNEKEIYGYIMDYYVLGNKLSLTLKSKEKVLCSYYFDTLLEKNEFLEKIELGDYVLLTGNLKEPNENTIFNLFNYKNYLKNENIFYLFEIDKINFIKRNDKIRYKIKNYIISLIENNANKEYLYTFVLGNNKYLNNDIKESYRKNGISHLFAISGMHVSLLSLIILKILDKFRFKHFVVLLIIIFYMFLTNFQPSIIRAGIMYVLIYINKLFKLNINNINLMILLLSISLLIDNKIIYKIGFQYSYLISFSLILTNNRIKKSNYKLLFISFIAFLVSLPITINNFYEINLLSIFLNIIFVPIISTFIFPLSILSIFLPIDNYLKIFITIFENTSLFFSKVNFFVLILEKMNLILFFLFLILIIYIIKGIIKFKYIRILFIFILLFIHNNINYLDSNFKITFIDVGQGDSILIKMPNSKSNILIDTGGVQNYIKEDWIKKDETNYISNNIISYLKSIGIKSLDYLIITHGDFDHMGEAINLVNNFKVEKVIFNCGTYNDLEKELIKVLDKKRIKYYSCIKELDIDKNKLSFLQTKEYDNENDNSNVIITEFNGYKFMFMGDASVTTEKEIMNKYNLADIDVLKVGHHGSRTSSGEEFIDEINPNYSIISVGKNNRYGHPNKEVLDSLEDSKIYRTDEDGSIMFRIKNNKLQIETCTP